jgi:hypothetical protein
MPKLKGAITVLAWLPFCPRQQAPLLQQTPRGDYSGQFAGRVDVIS